MMGGTFLKASCAVCGKGACTKLCMLCKALWSMRVPWARPCPGETGLSYLFSPPLYQLYTQDVLGQHQLRQKHIHKHIIHTSDKRSIHYVRDHLENKMPGKAEAFSLLQLKTLNEVCALVTSLYEALNSASLASTSMQYNVNFFYKHN